MTYVHVNYTRYTETCCVVNDCPTCNRQRRMLAQFQEWYGWAITCTGCGDQWQDGELLGRPFCPGWRQDRIKTARAELARIGVPA